MRDIHEEITNKIVEQLEKGTAPWRKSWQGNASFDLPKNGTTNQHYHGINIPLLWLSAEAQGFDCQEWGSFNHWRQKKGMVDKGQKGTMVIYYDSIEKQKDDKIEKVPFIKSSYVFNRCQLQNYKPVEKVGKPLVERLDHVDRYILKTGAKIAHKAETVLITAESQMTFICRQGMILSTPKACML